jgi:hypothetical protein
LSENLFNQPKNNPIIHYKFVLVLFLYKPSNMKKNPTIQLTLVFLAMAFANLSMAQTHGSGPVTPVKVGSVVLNVGLGIGGNYKGDSYGTAFGFKVAAEWGLWQAGPGVITLGPELGGSFSHGGYHYNNVDNYKSSTFVVAGRAAWHYGWEVPGLDTYGGFSGGVGFHHYGYDDNGNGYTHNEAIPVFGGFVGASYFISPTFGFNAEAGYDITNFQVGVVFKLQ